MIRCASLLCVLVASIAPLQAAQMRGHVVDSSGSAVAKATVYLYWCAPTEGPLNLPSVYPEWGKHALSDAQGNFVIDNLDEAKLYSLLVVAEGFVPVQVERRDCTSEVEAQVREMPEDRKDPGRMVKGRVLDEQDKPVWGAEVRTVGMKTGNEHRWGRLQGIDPLTVTDPDGKFVITTHEPDLQLDLRIIKRGFATQLATFQPPGEQVHEYHLTTGANVTGKLMKDGQPAADITLGAVQVDASMEHNTGEREAVSDDKGVFTFPNLGAKDEYKFYTKMKSAGESGAMTLVQVTTPGENETGDLGTVELKPAHTITAKLRVPEGEELPAENVRVTLRRNNAVDSITVAADSDGVVKLVGVPSGEQVLLLVQARGFALAPENVSADPALSNRLIGKVDQDLELDILLEKSEPGRRRSYTQSDMEKREELFNQRLEGVAKEKK